MLFFYAIFQSMRKGTAFFWIDQIFVQKSVFFYGNI